MRFLKKKAGTKKNKNASSRQDWLKRFRPRFPRYFRDSFGELKKVTWPTRREAWKMTLAVFVFSFLFALFVVVADFGIQIAAEELFL